MSRLRKLIKLAEYTCHPKPVCLSPDIAQTIRDHLKNYLEIAPVWGEPDSYWLTARQYVGDIIVGDIHICIRSEKAPTVNLFWMLTFAYDLPDFRDQVAGFTEETSLFEFLVAIFAGQVESLIRHGIVRSYQHREDSQPQLRGRLDLTQQLRRSLVHPEQFAVCWSEHTLDVLENRLLKHVLLRLASVRYPRQWALGSRLRKAYAAFDLVTYVPITLHDFDDVRYNRLNQNYRGPLTLARLLWQHLSLRNEPGKVPFSTYLFDLNVLFERFIATYLRATLMGSRLRAKPRYRTALDYAQRERAEIDIVLLQNDQPVLVLDTKYKTYAERPAREDQNQVFTYCHTLRVKRGVLLYPSKAHLRDKRLMAGVTLEILGISLGGTLDQFQRNLENLKKELIEITSDTEPTWQAVTE
jgi:5-methylcytosine-specific restriction enzyme subunit McrC